jgi:hypothetical protein
VDLYGALLLDIFSVLCCAALLWKYAKLTALHPASTYLLFHVLVVTSRAYFILAGSPTLFTAWGPGVIPLSDAEIAWAVNLADLALLSMTAAWIKVASNERPMSAERPTIGRPDSSVAMLSPKVIRYVGAIALPIGLVALFYFAYVPTVGNYGSGRIDLGDWNSSSWLMITQGWAGLTLLSLIYYQGFRRLYVAPLCIYLMIMAVQGFDRFRLVIPLIFMALVWLSRARKKWPPIWIIGAGFAMLIAVVPLKNVGRMVQSGATVSEIQQVVVNSFDDIMEGRASDHLVLDEFACTVSLVDESHRYFYGSLYYPLLTLPIPRQLWWDKPAVNEYQYELSSPSRPMAASGMVPTLHGESYANFGPLGIIITSFVVAHWLGRFYFAAMQSSYFSVYRFTYIVVACNLVQVFRDGLISLVIFTIVNMVPLVAIAILSYVSFRRKKAGKFLRGPFLPGRPRGVTQRSV